MNLRTQERTTSERTMSTAPTGFGLVKVFTGSTTSQQSAPTTHRPAATRKDAVHPYRAPIQAVRYPVNAPPICPPMFMNPETDPAEAPAISAVTDQNELCAR